MKISVLKIVCSAIALAMGIAVIVTSIYHPLSKATVDVLLAFAVVALGIAGFQR